MLVLTRKVGEEIIIGDKIHITVVAIERGKVRIGIDAPKEIVVDRQEVHDKRKDSFSGGPALTLLRAAPSYVAFAAQSAITPTRVIGTMPA